MSKIELPSIANPSNVSLMNSNFKKIEDALNEEVLYRRGYTGEPNEMNTNLDMNGRRILNVAVGPDSGDLATKGYVDQGLSSKYDKTGGPLLGDVQMGGHRISGLPDATQPSEAATYNQLLQLESGVDSLLRNDLAAPGGSSLVGFKQSMLGSVNRTVEGSLRDSVSVKDFGAVGNGIADDTAALNAFWAYIKTDLINIYPTTLPFTNKKYILPSGTYRVTSPINWTGLQAWNVHIEANGAVIIGEVNGKSIIDNIGCRGVHVQGLGIIGHPSFTPKSGILVGPIGTNTCGNNKFSDVKILGRFSIAPMHNIGSETTRHESCYYMNQSGFAMAGDALNRLGAVSDYQAIRGSGVAVSFTHNAFASCRFENGDKTGTSLDAVYLEATNGWTFDQGCYYLAFDGAGFRIVDMGGVFRTGNLKIDGLFETSQAPGLKYAVRVVVGSDSINSSLSSSSLSIGRSHAKTAGIRVETVSGAPLVTGSYAFRDCDIKVDDFPDGATKIFDGARLIFIGHIVSRYGSVVNVNDLMRGYGTITCDNPSTIPPTNSNPEIAFACYGEGVLANQGLQFMLGSGASVGMQGGVHPLIRAISSSTDADLRLQGQGTGVVRFGTTTANVDAPVTGYITIKDAAGVSRKLAIIN